MDGMNWIVSLIVFIVANITGAYLLYIINKTAKKLKVAFIWLFGGITIALILHSFIELLVALDVLKAGLLLGIMPVFVLIGSIFILIGSQKLYNVICSVSRGGLKLAKIEWCKRRKAT